jgi:hypothetical protein
MSIDLASSRPQLTASSIDISVCHGIDVPSELHELRRIVWGEETGLLADDELFNGNDRQGVHILVYEIENGRRLIAATCAIPAENSDFAIHTGLSDDVLRDTIVSTRSTVHPDYRGSGLLSLLIYLGARAGRMQGRRWLAGFIEPGMSPGRKVSGVKDLPNVPPRRVKGRDREYEVICAAIEVNQGMFNCFERIPEPLQVYLREHFFTDEIVTAVMAGAKSFYEGAWFRAIQEGTLTRWQYLCSLAQMHQYVRWTTRLLGAVVGITMDRDLRRHYLRHLDGEVDHELMLENDIRHLGGDVDYVKHGMPPADDILAFMALEESLCTGPRRDPALFLAVPFAMEALGAFLTQDFFRRLSATIESWRVSSPARAMTFLAVHASEDGGADGHWDAARRILHRYVTSEKALAEFLSIIRVIHDNMDRAFTVIATSTDIFAAKPVSQM